MRWLSLLTVVALGGCNWMCGKVAETVVEKAAGVEVDQSGNTVTIKTKEGTITSTGSGGSGTVVVTNEKGEKAVMTGDGEKMRIEGPQGVIEYGGGDKAPAGFPLSVLGSAKITGSSHQQADGKEHFMLMLQTDQAPLAVADHYAKELEGKGFKLERTQVNAGGQNMASVSATKDGATAQVTAMAAEGQPQTQVTVVWATK